MMKSKADKQSPWHIPTEVLMLLVRHLLRNSLYSMNVL